VDNVTLQVKTLLMQLEVSKENITGQIEGLNQAKLGLSVANTRYEAGVALASEIIDSEFSYTQAQTAYLQGVFDYYSSILKLKRLIGE
jgi:outer membrane protein TolC